MPPTPKPQPKVGLPDARGDEGHQQGNHEKNKPDSPKRVQRAGQFATDQQRQAQIGSDGEQIAVGKVDEFQHTIDHGVAQGYQGVDPAHGQTVHKLLEKLFHSAVKKAVCPPGHMSNAPADASGKEKSLSRGQHSLARNIF